MYKPDMNIILVALAAAIIIPGGLVMIQKEKEIENLEAKLEKQVEKTDPNWLSQHQREVWLAVLEWCESRGIVTAVNPQDSDKTPSFGAFQFKPDTFRGYAEKYNISGSLMDYDAQLAILKRMLDDPTVKWAEREFPGCIAKIGLPPKRF